MKKSERHKKKRPMKDIKITLHKVPFQQVVGALLKTPPPVKKWRDE